MEGGDRGAKVIDVKFRSAAVGREQDMSVVVPEGAGRRPLLIFLHGKGGDEDTSLHDEMFAALDEAGLRAPVIAFPDGGGGSYWHDRDSGDWAAYVRDEVPGQVARVAEVDLERVAIGGISMGGFGAFSLAFGGSYCAAGGHSPALWNRFQDAAPGAFDDVEDFVAHDVIAKAEQLPRRRALWVDVGAEDPFRDAARDFARAAGAKLKVWPGGHEGRYWREHWDEYMDFYADALWECDTRY